MEFVDCNNNTVQLMKLFQDNVKKEIHETNEIVQVIEKRIENLYKDLASLKESKQEVSKDFNEFSTRIDTLSMTYKSFLRKLKTSSTSDDSGESDSDTENAVKKLDDLTESIESSKSDEDSERFIITYDENNNEIKTKITSWNDSTESSKKIGSNNDDYNELMNMLMKNLMLVDELSRKNKQR